MQIDDAIVVYASNKYYFIITKRKKIMKKNILKLTFYLSFIEIKKLLICSSLSTLSIENLTVIISSTVAIWLNVLSAMSRIGVRV